MEENLNPLTQLKAMEPAPEKTIRYTIDLTRGYNNLLEKEENQRSQIYLWDGNAAGFYDEGAENPQYYLQDELGSPLRIEGEDGGLRESYGYDEFGCDLYQNQGKVQPFGYTGYQHDRVAGTYFAQAREYDEQYGRFHGVDVVKGNVYLPITQNEYKYCLNQPIKYIDPTGCIEELKDCENMESIDYENIEAIDYEFISSDTYGYVINGLNISSASIGTYLKKAVSESVRPNNIGIGVWKRELSSQLDDIARLFGSSTDDVVRGFANSKIEGMFPKAIDKLGYVGAAIDAATGIKGNIEKGSSIEKTTSDAVLDATISAGSIWAAGEIGKNIGFYIGGFAPGVGNVVGAVVGFAFGVGFYYATDVLEIGGKNIRNHIKDGISNFFGLE